MACWKVEEQGPRLQWEGQPRTESSCGMVIVAGNIWGVVPDDPENRNKKGVSWLLRAYDLRSGAVSGETNLGAYHPSYNHLAFSDGLIGMSAYSNHAGSRLFVADPKNLREHGELLRGATHCITPAMPDGYLLMRTHTRIRCWRIEKWTLLRDCDCERHGGEFYVRRN